MREEMDRLGLAYLFFRRQKYCESLPHKLSETRKVSSLALQKNSGYHLAWMEPEWWKKGRFSRHQSAPKKPNGQSITPRSPLEVFLDLHSVIMKARNIWHSEANKFQYVGDGSLVAPNLGFKGEEADVILAYQGLQHIYKYAFQTDYSTIKLRFESLPNQGITEAWVFGLCPKPQE